MKLKTPNVPNAPLNVPFENLENDVEFIQETNQINGGYDVENPDIFYFTNVTKSDWTTQWNKVKYTFPANKTVRMAILSETPENVQNIRKLFAYRFAYDQFLLSKDYKNLVTLGKGTPSTFDEKILQPMIDECLKPLPKDKIQITLGKEQSKDSFKATKPIDEKSFDPKANFEV